MRARASWDLEFINGLTPQSPQHPLTVPEDGGPSPSRRWYWALFYMDGLCCHPVQISKQTWLFLATASLESSQWILLAHLWCGPRSSPIILLDMEGRSCTPPCPWQSPSTSLCCAERSLFSGDNKDNINRWTAPHILLGLATPAYLHVCGCYFKFTYDPISFVYFCFLIWSW